MHKPVYLIGMMGCGKSTMGRRLSVLLGCPFTDLDEAIALHEGRTIPQIFDAEGDSGFRIYESAALKRAAQDTPGFIATGGGIITREENIRLMRDTGLVVWLCRPLEDIIATVRQDTRPNLRGNKEERMRTLYAQREALYRRAAHITFDNTAPAAQSAKQLAATQAIQSLL